MAICKWNTRQLNACMVCIRLSGHFSLLWKCPVADSCTIVACSCRSSLGLSVQSSACEFQRKLHLCSVFHSAVDVCSTVLGKSVAGFGSHLLRCKLHSGFVINKCKALDRTPTLLEFLCWCPYEVALATTRYQSLWAVGQGRVWAQPAAMMGPRPSSTARKGAWCRTVCPLLNQS